MAVLGGPAGAVHALVATLTSHLHAALDGVWSLAGTSLVDGNNTITVAKQYPARIYAHGAREAFLEWPFVSVQATGGSYMPIQEENNNDLYHRLLVTFGIKADSPQLAEEQLARYEAAIYWTIQKYKLLDGNMPGLYNTQPGDYSFLAAKDAPAGMFIRIGRMQVTVMAEETIPF